MSLPLNQPFLRSVFGHFPLFQPFLEVFAGLALDQLLKGFPHGLLPGELPHHHKTDFIFLLFAFFRSLIECSLVEDKKIEMSVQNEKQTQWFQRLSGLRSGGRR